MPKTVYNGVEWVLDVEKPLERGWWRWVFNDVDERGDEGIQHSWTLTGGTCDPFLFTASGAYTTRTDRVSGTSLNAERENVVAMWRSLIGLLYFYHINTLNSIISFKINFLFFYTKIHDFLLSINRDWFIWFGHRKKTKFFTILILLLSLY
jgi:hypothetical protein